MHLGRYLAEDVGSTMQLRRTFVNGAQVGMFTTFTNMSYREFGEGSFDKGLWFKVPFALFTGSNTRSSYKTRIRSMQRDGGQRLEDYSGQLWWDLRDARFDSLNQNKDRIRTRSKAKKNIINNKNNEVFEEAILSIKDKKIDKEKNILNENKKKFDITSLESKVHKNRKSGTSLPILGSNQFVEKKINNKKNNINELIDTKNLDNNKFKLEAIDLQKISNDDNSLKDNKFQFEKKLKDGAVSFTYQVIKKSKS